MNRLLFLSVHVPFGSKAAAADPFGDVRFTPEAAAVSAAAEPIESITKKLTASISAGSSIAIG
jgi:hypothetical protein